MTEQQIIPPDIGPQARALAARLRGGHNGTDLLFDVAAFIGLPDGADITPLSEFLEAIEQRVLEQ